MRRIGIFGGTFNPIHFGHLRTAVEVREAFRLDEIILVPSATPPHKSGAASAGDRMAMVRTAIDGCPVLSVSDAELKRSGPSYTIETIHRFQSTLREGDCLFFIVGVDAFLEIDAWERYEELLAGVPFIVMSRPGDHGRSSRAIWERLKGYLTGEISGRYRFSSEQSAFLHPDHPPIHTTDVTLLDISATRIRERVRKGMTIRFLLPPAVEAYIYAKGLFR